MLALGISMNDKETIPLEKNKINYSNTLTGSFLTESSMQKNVPNHYSEQRIWIPKLFTVMDRKFKFYAQDSDLHIFWATSNFLIEFL